jgi:amidase
MERHSDSDAASPASEAFGVTRRKFLQWGAAAGAGASLSLMSRRSMAADLNDVAANLDAFGPPGTRLVEATIVELQSLMERGRLSARQLVALYLQRIHSIDKRLGLNSIIELNRDALRIARELDRERRQSGPRGPLHGIPILLKDNIDTGDGMMTTAGSLALVGSPALQDATVAARLRAAGAVILGKTNLSEWANFRGFGSSSGWSGVGGQCNNPYILDRNPCGSSSGSAAAVSGNLCAAALGTETDGSVVCPASACGVAGIKPTVGLTSRAGVVPISDTQDTVGVHGRTIADAAAVLGALTGVDPRDPKTAASDGNSFTDYTQFLDPNGLQGANIGVVRQFTGTTEETDQVFEQAVQALRDGGANVVDPVEIPSFDAFSADDAEIIVLIFEFKRDLNAYLATRTGVPVSSVADVIQFNLDHFEQELKFFGQQFFELAEAGIFSEADYLAALERGARLAGPEGIDAALSANGLDALVAPTGSPAWPNDIITGDAFQFGSSGFAAVAGYPLITMPAGSAFGLPVGITFMGTAWSEPLLIRLASGFEAAAQARRVPAFVRTFSDEVLDGALRPSSELQRQMRDKQRMQQLDRFRKPQVQRPRFL